MKEIDYVIWKEDNLYVAQCLNVEVSSFGESIADAIKNIKEAVELYFEDEPYLEMRKIDSLIIGKELINA